MEFQTLSESEWKRVDAVRDLVTEGRLDAARSELRTLLSRRPGHPDLRIVEAMVAIEEGEPRRALESLRGAERSADPAEYFYLRALARFDLADFDAARSDAEQALAVHPDLARGHDLLSRVLEHLGDDEGARAHAGEAYGIDPEACPLPLEVNDEEFDAIVRQSIRELPPRYERLLQEVPVVVQPLPTRAMLAGDEPALPPDLLGLFVGRSLLERSHQDVPTDPEVILLFRRNLLRECGDRDELAREIRITVQHELGHLLGGEEEDLEDWGLA